MFLSCELTTQKYLHAALPHLDLNKQSLHILEGK